MLQYILTQSDRYSTGELAQMAVEGGCMWITLGPTDMSDEELRSAVAPDVVDMCREAGVFLTVDDRPALARDLGLHGVRLSMKYMAAHPEATPMSIREELGPEAVIGIETVDPTALPGLVPADIDFVTLPPTMDAGARRRFVEQARAAGSEIPVVAEGDFDPAEAAEALRDGCNGVATGRPITDAPDPVAATESLIAALQGAI